MLVSLRSVVFLALLFPVTACSTTGLDPSDSDPPATDAASVPLLDPGLTLGTTLYGGADLNSLDAPERALLDSAVARGLNGFTYYVDWADLEPAPGDYTLDTFTATLQTLDGLGIRPFVNVTVGDIESYNLPEELSDGSGGLADGVALDDPAVLDRFGALLDRIVPVLMENGGFFLGVGNEIDARLDGEFPGERGAYVQFVEAARERVHAIEPRLAVGVTLTTPAVREQTRTYQAIRSVSDVVPINYAPIQDDFFVEDQDDIAPDFRDVLAAYGEGPILIQELTCPSPASMGASESWQRGCFERLFSEIETSEQVRFASVFTFQDFDESTCRTVRDLIFGDELDDLPDDVAERLADYLCFLGVVRSDGSPKPAWDVLLEAAATRAD
ncbi:hypothetical protein [Longibacter sp.]|jgi:hypothetical protein|uniref:hypothetical protein n=1 Tax=Longibacter sp. TaxID=2045415 RepID=UPI003EB9DFBF